MANEQIILVGILVLAVIAFVIISAGIFMDSDTCISKTERVFYRGRPDLKIQKPATETFIIFSLLTLIIMVSVALASCTAAPKPDLIPLQAEPVKAQSIPMQTWLYLINLKGK